MHMANKYSLLSHGKCMYRYSLGKKSISLSVYSASESISLEIMQAAHAVYWKMKTCLYEIYLLHVVPAFSYHMGSIPAVCTLHWHLCCPRSHHRWCPKCR